MSLHELDRKQLVVPINVIGAAEYAAGASPRVLAQMIVPQSCLVVGLSAQFQTQGGTAGACTFDLRRSTTVLASVTVATAATPVRSSPLSVRLNAGETVNINGTLNNINNTFSGLTVTLELQLVPDL